MAVFKAKNRCTLNKQRCTLTLHWTLTFLPCALKGTQTWNFFLTFFAETETLWSQGPVTQDFWKSYSIRTRYSTFKHFCACSASDEIHSRFAQPRMKFVPRMISIDCTCKTVHILPLAEHARKFVPRMLSVRWNSFRVCSVCEKICSANAQHGCTCKNCSHFTAGWACAKICSFYAQCAIKSFPHMLRIRML